MKGFNRKRFASLAASAMVAAATLTPMSGIFASGIAHAATANDLIRITGPARLFGGALTIPLTYKCDDVPPIAPANPPPAINVWVIQARPGASAGPVTTPPPIPVTCNSQQINTVVNIPAAAAPGFGPGPLAVAAQLTDNVGTLTATDTQIVNAQ